MAERITSRRVGAGQSSLFNWLKWLDQEVRTFPSGADWLQHPPFQFSRCRLFMMARYPKLQRVFPDEVLSQEFGRGEQQMSEHQNARYALEGLSEQQRKELTALYLDTVNSLEAYWAQRRSATRVHKLAGETPRRTRMLTRKLERARHDLEDLRKYAGSLSELLGREYVRAAEICLDRLSRLKEDTDPQYYESSKNGYPALYDPATLGMVQLYWFFRHGAGLPGDEAEIRVGLLRNAVWTKYNIPEIPIRLKYITGESKGCDVVHTAVFRFKRGTLRPETR